MHRKALIFALVFLLVFPPAPGRASETESSSSVRTSSVYRFDFGPRRSPIMEGWTPVTESSRYTPERGYGLLSPVSSFYVTRRMVPEIRKFVLERSWVYQQYSDNMSVDGVRSESSVAFRVDLPNGTYRVRVWIGDLEKAVYSMNISFNGQWLVEGADAFHIASRSMYLNPFNYGFRVGYTVVVNVTEGFLTINVTGNDTRYRELLREEMERDPPYSYLAWMSQGVKKYSSGSGPWRYIGGPFTNASVLGVEIYPKHDMPVEECGGTLLPSGSVTSPGVLSAIEEYNRGEMNASYQRWLESLGEDLSGLNRLARAQVGLYLAGNLKLERELEILPTVERDLLMCQRELSDFPEVGDMLDLTRRTSRALNYYTKRTEYGKNHFVECDKAIGLLWTVHPQDPLYPKAMLWCARALYSLDPHRWTSASGTAKDLLERIRPQDPDNKYIRFYLDTDYTLPPTWENGVEVISTTGERDRWYLKDYNSGYEDAPEWAKVLREELCWLYDITDWWVDHRMKENGYLGGGWTDDVEFIGLFGFNALISRGADNKSLEGARRFVDGMLREGGVDLERGYSSAFADTEHTAELTGDSLPMMIAVDFGNPRWIEFSYKTAALMRDLWMGVNEKGYLQFKSNFLSATRVGEGARAEDSWINYRAALPARWVWWYSGDPEVGELFIRWADCWVNASLSTEKGKPYGVIPAGLGWPDGEIGGHNAPTWYRAAHPPGSVNYDWEPQKYKGYIVDLLLSAYEATGDLKYLEPLRLEAELAKEWSRRQDPNPPVGSRMWAAKVLYNKGAIETYQNILNTYGLPGAEPSGTIWTPESAYSACIKGYNYIRKCYPLMTTEASATDRVAFVGIINPFLIYTGGRVGGALLSPSYTYSGLGRDFAAVVTRTNRTGAEIVLYGFYEGSRNASLIPWALERGGEYTLTGGPDGDSDGEMDYVEQRVVFTFTSRGMEVPFTLPGGVEYIIRIEMGREGEVEDLLPDPAFGEEEVKVTAENSIEVWIHNIGSAPGENFTVALLDEEGEVVAEGLAEYLPPPKNFTPSVGSYHLYLLKERKGPKNYTLVIDPSGELTEITELNNEKNVMLNLSSMTPANLPPEGPDEMNLTMCAGESVYFSLPFQDPEGEHLNVSVDVPWVEPFENLTLLISPPREGFYNITVVVSDPSGGEKISILHLRVIPLELPEVFLPGSVVLTERERVEVAFLEQPPQCGLLYINVTPLEWVWVENCTLHLAPWDGDSGRYNITVTVGLLRGPSRAYNLQVEVRMNLSTFSYSLNITPLAEVYPPGSMVNLSVNYTGYSTPLRFFWIIRIDGNLTRNLSGSDVVLELASPGAYRVELHLEGLGMLQEVSFEVVEERAGVGERERDWTIPSVAAAVILLCLLLGFWILSKRGRSGIEE
ncbi:MAG: hypothetical protein DRN40_02480 [Thermoplasmata archaeon]|nr:MAG: hypothetical protein DRN40_02480 [Thermoplasmata archaeon]